MRGCLVFIYDKLQTKEEQEKAGLKLHPVMFGQTQAKQFFVNDSKQKRTFIIPSKKNSFIYGVIYLVQDYEEQKHKLHSYYYNSKPFTEQEMKEDLYSFKKIKVTPISFGSLKDIEHCTYDKGEELDCYCFVGNLNNKKIKHSVEKRYYRINKLFNKSFIEMISELKERKKL